MLLGESIIHDGTDSDGAPAASGATTKAAIDLGWRVWTAWARVRTSLSEKTLQEQTITKISSLYSHWQAPVLGKFALGISLWLFRDSPEALRKAGLNPAGE
jgi:hypothetical protein